MSETGHRQRSRHAQTNVIRAPYPRRCHNSLRSSGTSPNFLITVTSLRPPVEGSRLRLNASAPTYPGFWESASARITAAFELKHSTGLPGEMPLSEATKGSAT
jgi:hypothetical protein